MMRVALTFAVIGLICAAGYYVLSHPNLEQIEHMSAELEALKAQNHELARKNAELEERIVALRDDPRLAERRARETVGLARPDEIIFQFEEPEQALTVAVRLSVREDRLELAGRPVELEALGDALEALRREMPTARLTVAFAEDLGAIRRQRVIDIVDQSSLAPAQYVDP